MVSRLDPAVLSASCFLAGPTASGKSAVAMALAERRDVEILALDSMTLYRGFDIGTAKPTPAERARVRHHLIDVLPPLAKHDVAQYLQLAAVAAEEVLARDRTPLFVGGAGLYLRTLLRGLFDGPPRDESLRSRLQSELERTGPIAFHERLRAIDLATAARLHPNDVRRVTRAREVFELTGRPLSQWHAEQQAFEQQSGSTEVRCVWIEPPRTWLHERIDRRVADMLQAGWLQEVEGLLALDPPSDTIFWSMLGYPELAAVVRGEQSLEEAERTIAAQTRQFAKRQCTWFRGLPECTAIPLHPEESLSQLVDRVERALFPSERRLRSHPL